jgi:hypothetical protein
MCPDPGAYVEARVLQRLLDHGVRRSRAEAVARKVRRGYDRKRSERLQLALDGARRARELDDEILTRARLYGR